MNSNQRLKAALVICLREVGAGALKVTCHSIIDELTATLPKEQGGTKVMMSGAARGRSVPQLSKKRPTTKK